jgi:hypothetical protein
MRIPLLHADFEHGSFNKVSKALGKVWPFGRLSVMRSQNALAVLLGYGGLHDAHREAVEAFSAEQDGSISMQEITSTVVSQMYLRYQIDPIAGRALIPRLHLHELAIAGGGVASGKKMLSVIEAAMTNVSRMIETTDRKKAHIFVDEGWSLLQTINGNDSLRELLREIEGIPNAKYQVRGDRVFVFEKLVKLVDAVGMKNSAPDLPAIAKKLANESIVSPQDAVTRWSIVPAPYEFTEIAGGGAVIRHVPFNANVPGQFESKEAAQSTLVSLLMGQIVDGDGEFEYRGQPLRLHGEPLNFDGFTMAPPVVSEIGKPRKMWCRLDRIEWRPGFFPVPESLFAKAREIEASWKQACASMEDVADQRAEEVWAAVDGLDLARLNDPEDTVPDYGLEQVDGLRSCYPELVMLSDGALWSTYDTYQEERWSMSSWDPNRDREFIFFLIGRLTDPRGQAYAATDLGQWTAYHWLLGNALNESAEFAKQVRYHNAEADRIASRIADAMRFLEEESKAIDLRGPKIHTFGDTMRMGRSHALTTYVEQDFSVLQSRLAQDASLPEDRK